MTAKILPRALTSYDLFKTFAVLLMIVDHIGFYFYPDDNWWRVAGRMCVPVWLFLVGYARSRDLGPRMWGGAIILIVASISAGMNIFPLNILATIIVVRLAIDTVMQRSLRDNHTMWAMNSVLAFIVIPTMAIVEYGSSAIILAGFGYMARLVHDGDPRVSRKMLLQYMAFAVTTFIGFQWLMFGLTPPQGAVLAVEILVITFALLLFKPVTFAGTDTGAKYILLSPFRLIGRHTFEIYVVHLLIFKALALLYMADRYQFMNWSWLN